MTDSLAPHSTQARLDARYGRTPTAQRRSRLLVIGTAIAFVVVFAAWVIWGGLSGTNASLEVRELGYSEATDTSIQVISGSPWGHCGPRRFTSRGAVGAGLGR